MPPIPGRRLRVYLVVSDAFSESSAERIQRLRQIAGSGGVFRPMVISDVGDIERVWSETRSVACGGPCR